jgi:hypothetical protein
MKVKGNHPMAKKTLFLVSALILIFSLTACSAVQLPWASASSSSTQTASLSNFAGQPVKNKLAVGLLQLESTDLALTTSQAKEMLPLWKAVKSLSKDSNTTPGEMAALYAQIQGVLTASQLQAIQKLNLSSSELTALVQKYQGQTLVNTSSSKSTTGQTAQSTQAQGGPGDQGGDIQGIAMQDPGLGGIVGGSTTTTQSSTTKSSSTSTTSTASQATLNLQLADPIISMLNARINAQNS